MDTSLQNVANYTRLRDTTGGIDAEEIPVTATVY